MATERLMTLAEVADHLRLNVETVRRYVRSGKLHAIRLGGGRAGYRVSSEEVRRLESGAKPLSPEEEIARLRAIWADADSIPRRGPIQDLAVQAIREMREENG
jgi:excisionase family DNA binding protein